MEISSIDFEEIEPDDDDIESDSADEDKESNADASESDDDSEDDSKNLAISCPICDEVWYTVIDGEACFEKPCKHLRFVWEQRGDIESFNGFDLKRFTIVARKAYETVLKTTSEDLTDDDILGEILFDEAMWEAIEVPDVDELLNNCQEFMTCGPNSYTVYFGIKKD